jgi:hypothetical protein
MGERRALIEGLKTPMSDINEAVEKEFVYGDRSKSSPPVPSILSVGNQNRVPLSTRIREDFAKALKRASLERQLQGVEPNTLQDILEEALQPWLEKNGYIP